MNSLFKAIIVSLLISLLGCGPRGESKSLKEIYERSQARFEDGMTNEAVNETIKPMLSQLAEASETLVADSSSKSSATVLADMLSKFGEKASPTTKQPLYELAMQLRAMSEEANNPSPGERMLIASRIYDAVSAELETVGFKN